MKTSLKLIIISAFFLVKDYGGDRTDDLKAIHRLFSFFKERNMLALLNSVRKTALMIIIQTDTDIYTLLKHIS
jgi:hypothetical protein